MRKFISFFDVEADDRSAWLCSYQLLFKQATVWMQGAQGDVHKGLGVEN
jgi:hypothetical protein